MIQNNNINGKFKINYVLSYSGVINVDTLIKDFKNNSEVSKYGQELKPEDPSLCLLTSGTTGNWQTFINSRKV